MSDQPEESRLEVELDPKYIHCCTAGLELRCRSQARDLAESFLRPSQYHDTGSCQRDDVDER